MCKNRTEVKIALMMIIMMTMMMMIMMGIKKEIKKKKKHFSEAIQPPTLAVFFY